MNNNIISFNFLKQLNHKELIDLQSTLGISNSKDPRPLNIIRQICSHHYASQGIIFAKGALEIMNDGFGFLRLRQNSYAPSVDDIYMSPSFIKKLCLNTGDEIQAHLKVNSADRVCYLSVDKILLINDHPVGEHIIPLKFEDLTPKHPESFLKLETTGTDSLKGKDKNKTK